MARKRIRNKPGNQASKHRTLPKEDKTDSVKRTNINTISSRVTIASAVDLPTQNTSSTPNTNSDQSKEAKQSKSTIDKHKDIRESNSVKELKELKKFKKPCQCDLRSNDKVYDSNSIKPKQLIECECEELKRKNLNSLQTSDLNDLDYRTPLINKVKRSNKADDESYSKSNDKYQQPQEQADKNDKKNEKSKKSKLATKPIDSVEPIANKKKRRFQTKYKYIDEDDVGNDLNNSNCLNDRNNNKFIQSDNELDKLKRQIDQLDQIDLNLIDNLSKNNLELENGKLVDKSQENHSIDLHQMKHSNNELMQTNSIELETQLDLDSGLNNSNASRTNAQSTDQCKQINKSSSIQAIASTAIKAKNHSNLMAKKERKTAKVLAIITGKFLEKFSAIEFIS